MRAVLLVPLLALAAFALAYPAYSQVATEGAGPAEVPGGLVPGDKTVGPVASVEADESKFDRGLYSKLLGIMGETPADGDPGVHDGERYYNVILVVSRDDGDDRDPDEVARENKDAVVKRLEQLGARDIAAAESLSFVTASVPAADVPGFSLHEEVYRVGDGEIPLALDLAGAVDTVDASPADVASAAGRAVDGAGAKVAVLDIGINRYDLFGDRIGHTIYCDHMGCRTMGLQFESHNFTSHGTLVAQAIAGSGPGHHGVAPGATLFNVQGLYTIDVRNMGFTNYLAHALDHAHSRGAQIANMSFGYEICKSGPSSFDLVVDEAVDKGMIVVKAAGNDNGGRPATVYKSLTNPCAANLITVGGVDDRTPGSISMYTGTSRGPATGSNLLKPEIVAPAAGIELLIHLSGDATTSVSGTSFSAPMVSGAAALVLGAYPELTPVEAKAALLLGATWTGPVPCTSAQYEEDDASDGCSHERQPRDRVESNNNRSLEILNNVGFGILNASRTLEYASNDGADRHVIRDSISDGDEPRQYRFTVTDADETVKVILSWLSQPHGGIFEQRDSTDHPTTADLNLRITGPGYDQTVASARQVNEFAVFDPPQAGQYTVTVTGTNLGDIPKSSQNYAIAATLPLESVPAANSPPAAESRTVTIDPTSPDPVAVRLYGSDRDGDAMSFSISQDPTSGTASTTEYIDDWVSRMIYNYTGTATAGALDSFGVAVSDGQAVGAGGTVTVVSEDLPPGASRAPYVPDDNTEWRIINAADHFAHGARSFTIPDGHAGATALVVESTGMDYTKLTINTDGGTYTVAVPDGGTRQIDLAAPLAINSMVLESDGIYEEIAHGGRDTGSPPADARIRVGLVGSAGEDAKSAEFSASSYPDRAIPDNTKDYSTTDTIVVPAGGTIHDVTVSVSIPHTHAADLRVSLTAPDGTETVLHDNTGKSRQDVIHTYSSQLEGLAGSRTDGNWRLSVGDYSAGDVGRLASWTLGISYTPDDPPSDLQLPGTVLFTDDFESKSLSKWTESGEGEWSIDNSRAHSVPVLPGHSWTNKVLHVDDCDLVCTMTMAAPVNLSRYMSAVLTFDRFVDTSLDPQDYVRVDAYDGSSWNRVFYWTHLQGDDGRWHHESLDLADYIAQDDFQVRFVAEANRHDEDIQVDRIRITALPPPDTMPPMISAPADAEFEATGPLTPLTAEQTGSPEVSDDMDPAPDVTNDAPAEGFPLGGTILTWTATDSAGNSATDVQTITVLDTTPPVFDPSPLPDTAPDRLATPSARDLVDDDVTVTSSATPRFFPEGSTTVTFTATDDSGNSSSITQNVVVDRSRISAEIARVWDGSRFVPFVEGIAVGTDMPRFQGTTDGINAVRLLLCGEQVGGPRVSEVGAFQKGVRVPVPDGTCTLELRYGEIVLFESLMVIDADGDGNPGPA